MGKKDVHLVAILDRSGSMGNLTEEMRQGFNTLKAQQLKEEGDTYITLVTFDTAYERLYTGVSANLVPDLTSNQYFARGGTALFDAIGRTISEVATLKNLPKKVLVVIATDGYENSSTEWRDKTKIKALIDKYESRARNPWSFIFMGAGVDAFNSAQYGFTRSTRTLNTTADYAGTQAFYGAVGATLTGLRGASGQSINSLDISGLSNADYGNNPTTVVNNLSTDKNENNASGGSIAKKPRAKKAVVVTS
jgi:hypothetical protein